MGIFSGTVFYLILCVLTGVYASTLNRNGFGWFFGSLFVSPIMVSLILMILGDPNKDKVI